MMSLFVPVYRSLPPSHYIITLTGINYKHLNLLCWSYTLEISNKLSQELVLAFLFYYYKWIFTKNHKHKIFLKQHQFDPHFCETSSLRLLKWFSDTNISQNGYSCEKQFIFSALWNAGKYALSLPHYTPRAPGDNTAGVSKHRCVPIVLVGFPLFPSLLLWTKAIY